MPTISFKVSAEEARAIRRQARSHRCTVSDFLRKAALPAVPAKKVRLRMKKHPVSGLLYNAAEEGGPVVTDEQVREALADFP